MWSPNLINEELENHLQVPCGLVTIIVVKVVQKKHSTTLYTYTKTIKHTLWGNQEPCNVPEFINPGLTLLSNLLIRG